MQRSLYLFFKQVYILCAADPTMRSAIIHWNHHNGAGWSKLLKLHFLLRSTTTHKKCKLCSFCSTLVLPSQKVLGFFLHVYLLTPFLRWAKGLFVFIFIFLVLIFRGVGVNDEEGSGEEAKKGSPWSDHRNDPHSAYSFHNCAKSRCHQNLRNVNLAWQDGTVDTKASARVTGTVTNVL